MTYHYNNPPEPDSLYVALDMPSVKEPSKRTVMLSEETKKQIPRQIMDFIESTCQDYGIRFDLIDYYYSGIVGKASLAYENAPIDEILRFASIGTEVAIEFLDRLEEDGNVWKWDKDLASSIYNRLKTKLDVTNLVDYKWWYHALHFVANPLGFHQNLLVFPHLDQAIKGIKFILEKAKS